MKPEVTGLDDAGMHRADRNLMERRPLCRMEWIADAVGLYAPSFAERILNTPASVIEPGPWIRTIFGNDPVKIADRALEAQGGRMRNADGRKVPVGAGQAHNYEVSRRLVQKRHVNGL